MPCHGPRRRPREGRTLPGRAPPATQRPGPSQRSRGKERKGAKAQEGGAEPPPRPVDAEAQRRGDAEDAHGIGSGVLRAVVDENLAIPRRLLNQEQRTGTHPSTRMWSFPRAFQGSRHPERERPPPAVIPNATPSVSEGERRDRPQRSRHVVMTLPQRRSGHLRWSRSLVGLRPPRDDTMFGAIAFSAPLRRSWPTRGGSLQRACLRSLQNVATVSGNRTAKTRRTRRERLGGSTWRSSRLRGSNSPCAALGSEVGALWQDPHRRHHTTPTSAVGCTPQLTCHPERERSERRDLPRRRERLRWGRSLVASLLGMTRRVGAPPRQRRSCVLASLGVFAFSPSIAGHRRTLGLRAEPALGLCASASTGWVGGSASPGGWVALCLPLPCAFASSWRLCVLPLERQPSPGRRAAGGAGAL